MSQPTACAVFSIDELWLLQSVIRHEVAQQESWRYPPASLSLNEQVAEALVRCDDLALPEAALLLTREDCLAIDHNLPQGAKSAAGVPVGRNVLMKSFRARRELEDGPPLTAALEDGPTQTEMDERIEQWKNRRRRKRST